MRLHRATLLAAALLMFVTACTSAETVDDTAPAATPAGETTREATAPSPGEDPPSALDEPGNPAFPDPLIDLDELKAGGPPPDGIPPIDQPKFAPAEEIDWLQGNEGLLVLTVNGETRGYPLRVMTWHEIVNDRVGGVPVAVTYCPLCNSGVAFERTVEGVGVVTFGTSGMLYADNLVMYDRSTQSLWPQLTGQASVGALTGTQLTAIPMGIVGWQDFLEAHPDAPVLTRDTGFDRPYGTNPYAGYDDPDGGLLFSLPGELDQRLLVKERVVGISDDNESVAVVRTSLADQPPLEVKLGDRRLVVWHRPGQNSALDTGTVSGGADIGTVGVFHPRARGRELHFEADGDGFVDQETGSRWNVLGRATSGPLQGAELRPYRHLDTFWFAWVTFHPDTQVIGAGDEEGTR